jgi:hypothetical protein
MADTQVAPDQQQAPDTLPADFFQTKGTDTTAPDTLPADFKFKETSEEKPQPSIMHNVGEYGSGLAHSLGLPSSTEEYKQQAEAATEVSPMNMLRAAGGPAVSAGEQVYNAGKGYLKGLWNTGKEAYEAGQNIAKGGPVLQNIAKPASEYLNTNVGAVPFIGQPSVEAGQDIAAGNKARAAGELTGVVGQVVLPEVLDRMHPEQTMDFHNKAVETAQKKLDTAKKAAEPYADSAAKGVLPPNKVQAPIEKAQTELNEATFHRDTHRDAMNARRTNVTNPKQPTSQPEVPTEQIEAMKRPGAPKPAAAPQNVKTPGQVQPEVVPQPLLDQPRTATGRMQLPDEQGTMGKPRQLTAGTNPPTGSSNLEDVVKATEEKHAGVPKLEAPAEPVVAPKAEPKVETPAPKPTGMRDMNKLKVNEKGEVEDISVPKDRLHQLLQQSLETETPKANEPATPKAKNPAIPENYNPENDKIGVREKMEHEASIEKRAAAEAETKGTHDEKGVRKEPANVRKPGEELTPEAQAVQHKALESISSLSNDRLDTMAREMGIDPSDPIYSRAKEMRGASREQTGRIRQANAILERMGSDEINKAAAKADQINGDAASANWARAKRADAVFEDRLSGAPEGGYGAKNTGVTKEAYEAARKRAQEKLGSTLGMSGGNLPLSDWAIQARYHVEAGARSFADFSEKMLAEAGEAIRPHLQALFEQANGKAVLENAKESTETTPKLTNTEAAVAETEKQTPLSRSVEETEHREGERRKENVPVEDEHRTGERRNAAGLRVDEEGNPTLPPDVEGHWQSGAFGEKPITDIGAKAREANPEPTRAETKGEPTTAGGQATVDTAKSDNEHFANAKKELGDKASIREVADRAQELKDRQSQADAHNENGGSTFHPTKGNLDGKPFFSVGGEPEFRDPKLKMTTDGKNLTAAQIDEFSKRPEVKAALDKHKDASVGSWFDQETGKTTTELVKTPADRDEAIAMGTKNGEKAIWDLKNREEIKTGGTGEGPAKEGFPDKIERSKVSAKIPTGDQLIKKYGEASGVDPRGMTFILDDGRVVNNLGSDHDVMLGGKATDDKPRREQFVAGGNIRVRAHGKEVTFSIPASGVNAGQLAVIQKMSPQLRSGAVMFEVGDKLGSKYEAIPHGEATDERIEQTIQNITGKANPPKSLGSASAGTAFGKEAPLTPKQLQERLPDLAQQHLTQEEKDSITTTATGKPRNAGTSKFIQNMTNIPTVKEYTDIALQGEGARKWYSRSTAAFDAMHDAAPDYFKDGDKEKFMGVLAGSSPQQAVVNNLRETLAFWKEWVDAGRPEFSLDKWQKFGDVADAAWKEDGSPRVRGMAKGASMHWDYAPTGDEWKNENLLLKNLTLPETKVPNIIKALNGEPMWPDLQKNAAFKAPSFAENLRKWIDGKSTGTKYVTNDSWMGLFGGIDKSALSKPENYHPLSVATRAAAEALGWEPEEAQAAIWSFTQALTEKGVEDPELVRHYSEDFKDLLANDNVTRDLLKELGVNIDELDRKLDAIEDKPQVSGRSTATTAHSVGQLKSRIEEARGKGAVPEPKSVQVNLFRENPAFEQRANPGAGHYKDEATEFNPEKFGDEADKLNKPGEKKKPGFKKM